MRWNGHAVSDTQQHEGLQIVRNLVTSGPKTHHNYLFHQSRNCTSFSLRFFFSFSSQFLPCKKTLKSRTHTARAITPVTIPVLIMAVRFSPLKLRYSMDGGFIPFLRYPICTTIHMFDHKSNYYGGPSCTGYLTVSVKGTSVIYLRPVRRAPGHVLDTRQLLLKRLM